MTTTEPAFVRLSDSPIWDVQRAYFEQQGPRAWASGTVPHYVTCNPVMGRAFAEVLAGFASDCARARPVAAAEPRTLHIVELGAGSGRLGWNIVRALRAAVDAKAQGWRFVYVLTDISEETIAWWQTHPQLAPLIAAGLVDVARFDATCDRAITLRASGRIVDPERPADELVVVANYVFDGLPTDVFEAVGGELYECLVATSAAASPAGRGFGELELAWRARPAPRRSYDDAIQQRILEEHAAVDGVFPFPTAALSALDRLRALTRGPLLVLSADKGTTRLDELAAAGPPSFATHGSLSMQVNFAALGAWALAHGGSWFHNEHHHGSLEVCAMVLGTQPRAATIAGFERAIAQRGPDDFYALKRLLVARAAELTCHELLAYLRLSGYDAKLFLDCAPALRTHARSAHGEEQHDYVLALARVLDGYLSIGEGDAVAELVTELAALVGIRQAAPAFDDEDPFDVATGRAAGMSAA
ncbi:MAG TPA: SAM-dependent methyltransferase [Kofleriaceae bacterium]|nr:SAM-dependent methyltransferase [Kofleriaceae bacterium]